MNRFVKKNYLKSEIFDDSKAEYEITDNNKFKTTDINILLNRVRTKKKIEYKKKIIFSLLTLIFTGTVGVFFLF